MRNKPISSTIRLFSTIRLVVFASALLFLSACGTVKPVGVTSSDVQISTGPTALPTWTPVPTPEPGSLYVDVAQALGPISPFVTGANYGPWGTVPVDLVTQAEEASIGYLKFPGGNYGDQNNLTVLDIDRFIKFARSMNSEPSISVRLEGGSPEAAAEIVRYTNIEKGYAVRYWSIGNEPNLFDASYDTGRYNQDWRAFAEAMRAVDPSILLVGPDISQYTADSEANPKDGQGVDWMQAFLTANGDLVDVVSIHRYPFPTSRNAPPPSISDLAENSQEWDAIIPYLREQIREYTGRDLPVAVTEVNSNWSHAAGGEATPDSYYNAVWWADVLGRLIRQQVDIVAFFSLQSSSQVGAYGLLERYDVRPVYYVYPIYKEFGRTLLYASSDQPGLSIYASRRDDGAVTLVLVNLSMDERQANLKFDNLTPGSTAEIWQLDPTLDYKKVGEMGLKNEQAVLLPGQSVSFYLIK